MDITLRPITIDNFEVFMDMELPPEQARYVASNSYSIAQSHYYPALRPRGIYLDQVAVGFAMYDVAGNDEPGHYAIYRLMVDHPRQNRGIGRRALALLLDEIRGQADARRITICYKPDNTGAKRLYASLGFIETAIDDCGEMIAEIRLRA